MGLHTMLGGCRVPTPAPGAAPNQRGTQGQQEIKEKRESFMKIMISEKTTDKSYGKDEK